MAVDRLTIVEPLAQHPDNVDYIGSETFVATSRLGHRECAATIARLPAVPPFAVAGLVLLVPGVVIPARLVLAAVELVVVAGFLPRPIADFADARVQTFVLGQIDSDSIAAGSRFHFRFAFYRHQTAAVGWAAAAVDYRHPGSAVGQLEMIAADPVGFADSAGSSAALGCAQRLHGQAVAAMFVGSFQ